MEPFTLDLAFISREKAIKDTDLSIYQYEADNLCIKVMFDYMKGDYEKIQQLLNVNKLEKLFSRMRRNINVMAKVSPKV